MIEEPVLMQNQQGALNQDTFAQKEFIRLKDAFNLKNCIETGTCLGYTTAFLAEHYENVHTIEINSSYLHVADINRIGALENVTTHLGDSPVELSKIFAANAVGDTTFIFLDAHWGAHCPLKQELKAIKVARIKPVIAIHDFQVPNHPELGYDMIGDQPFNFQWLKPEFDAIYGAEGYHHHYNSEAVGAKRGIIYITPTTKK